MAGEAKFKRVLLKLSGEALMGSRDYGIDPPTLDRLAEEFIEVTSMGSQLAIVIGGGNIFRGVAGAAEGLDRATGDYMGMLATVMNALALQEALIHRGHEPAVFSAFNVEGVVNPYERRAALHALDGGRIIILAGGTGRPFFTTDTAAALRALELDCDVVLKASHVDGVYDSDPAKNPDARRFEELSYAEAIDKRLKVMDLTAFSLCWENQIPLIVFDMRVSGNLGKVLMGDTSVGTVLR